MATNANSGDVYVIATLRDKANIVGYRLVDLESGNVTDIESSVFEALYGGNNGVVDAKKTMMAMQYAPLLQTLRGVSYDPAYKCLISTTAVKLTDLPALSHKDCTLKSKQGTFVLSEVFDSSGTLQGYVVVSVYGELKRVTKDSMSSIVKATNPVNYELVTQGTEVVAKPLRGYKFLRSELEHFEQSSYRSGVGETDTGNKSKMKKVPVYSLQKVVGSEYNKKANQKLLLAVADLKRAFPYYWVLLQAMNKKPADDSVCPTMGVTENMMYYNVKFVDSLSVPELVFLFMHEIMHIAMRHSYREGKRDHKRWNIACDLYINEMICHDLDLVVGSNTSVNVKIAKTDGTFSDGVVEIMAPHTGWYFSRLCSENNKCDLSRDTPEQIYNRLEIKNNQNSGGGSGQKQKNQGQGSSNNSDGSEQQQQGQSQGGSSGDQCLDDGDEVYYNGEKLEGGSIDDIMTDVGHDSEEQRAECERRSNQTAQNMKTRKEMVEAQMGTELTCGMDSAAILQRIINFSLQGSVDWRDVLKNIILEKPRKKYTLASPETTYMNMGITLATRQRIGKPEKLKNIEICIDASGSIDDKLLNRFLSEVASMFNYYDVDGNLMYWNTDVCDCGLFSDRKGLKAVNSNWSGGTDVRCVFDFLAGKKKTVTGKSSTIKAKDIKAVIIITDGYFDQNYKEYETAFGKKTLWLIDGAPEMFNALFGKVIGLQNNDDLKGD